MSSLPDAYLFYGLRWKTEGIADWMTTKDDCETYLCDIVADKEKNIKQFYECYLGTCGYDDEPRLILAAGPMVFGEPDLKEKPVAFFVSFDCEPVPVELSSCVDWDTRVNAAADYLGWPKEDREIGWWLVTDN
jgi:hypothetical protein